MVPVESHIWIGSGRISHLVAGDLNAMVEESKRRRGKGRLTLTMDMFLRVANDPTGRQTQVRLPVMIRSQLRN